VEADPRSRDLATNYRFLTSAVIPRPIAWVTTVDPASGVVNAAPFSWFQAVCADPMMVMLSIQERAPGQPKDTLRNMRATGEFVVNLVPRAAAERMVQTSAEYPADVSEVEAVGLATVSSHVVRPPRIADSPVHLECRLAREVPLGRTGATTLVLGEVVHVAADDQVLDARGNLDPAKVTLVARMGGAEYCDTGHHFTIKRPSLHDAARSGS
jgi:flavin reductase (DIM6/NTAB) family NADH-FMN oxidoreductase RutF